MKSEEKLVIQIEKNETLGDFIQKCRQQYGWTQEELSWRTGINRTHIGRIERDECVPTVSTIERLEDAFRLPRLTLLELKQKAVAKLSISSEIEAEVGMAFRDLEQQLINITSISKAGIWGKKHFDVFFWLGVSSN